MEKITGDEVWVKALGFDMYEVSNLGRIRGLFYGGLKRKVPKIKTPQLNISGYLYVTIYKNKKAYGVILHRLIRMSFDGYNNKLDCRHLDGNKLNNTLSNLAWGTKKENEADKLLHGKRTTGEKNGQSKLTEIQVIEIKRQLKQNVTTYKLSEIFNISQQTISAISNNKIWKHIQI